MVQTYVTAERRNSVVAFITAACYMGALIGNFFAPSLIGSVGWEQMFFLFATVPVLLWVPLWLTFMSVDRDKNQVALSVVTTDESAIANTISSTNTNINLNTNTDIDGASLGASLIELIRSPPVLAICAAQYGQSWGMIGKSKRACT